MVEIDAKPCLLFVYDILTLILNDRWFLSLNIAYLKKIKGDIFNYDTIKLIICFSLNELILANKVIMFN